MPIETPIGQVNRKTGKLWAGENYGEQSQESYDKLFISGKLNPAQQAIDRATSSLATSAKNAPIIGPALNFLGGAVNTLVDLTPKPIQQAARWALDKNQEAAENIAARTGLPVSLADPTTIADVAMGGIGLAAKPSVKTALKETVQGLDTIGRGGPPTPQLATASVTPSLPPLKPNFDGANVTLTPQVMNLTVKNPDRIAGGIRQGSAESPQWKDAMRGWNSRRAQLKEQLETAAYEGKNTGKILETTYNDVSTGPTRLPDNEPAYKVDKFKEQSVIQPLTKKGNKNWQQQHHLFPKQESYQFVERMAKLGDDDDVLNLFLYAEELDAVMGGRLLNMLNMEDLPHSVLHSSRSRKIDGRQLQAIKMKNFVDNAKSTDELMDMFHDYIVDNIQGSKEQAHALNEMAKRLNKSGQWESLNILREKNFMGKNPKL